MELSLALLIPKPLACSPPKYSISRNIFLRQRRDVSVWAPNKHAEHIHFTSLSKILLLLLINHNF